MTWGARLLLLLLVAGTASCVRPWERETLSRSELQQPPFPLLQRGRQHVYQVREGAQGAYGSAGGGCGCN